MNALRKYIVHILNIVLVAVLALTLDGCSIISFRKKPRSLDRAPTRHIEYHRVPDAVPKLEKYHPYGTRNYTVKNRRYRVLKDTKGYVKRGYASWYGSSFHGRHTSTQEIYNLYGMTAASPELPLPCYAQVTNLANGKHVIVKVNDRGPFYGKRILDLSYTAAHKLGFAKQGVAYVQVVALGKHNWDYENNRPKKHAPFLKHSTPHHAAGSEISRPKDRELQKVRAAQVVRAPLVKKTKQTESKRKRTAVVGLPPIEDREHAYDELFNTPQSPLEVVARKMGSGDTLYKAADGKSNQSNKKQNKTGDSSVAKKREPFITYRSKKPEVDGQSANAPSVTESKVHKTKWLQIATFNSMERARVCQKKIKDLLPEQKVIIRERSDRHMYSVQVGPVSNKNEMAVLQDRAKAAGFKPLIVMRAGTE